MLRATSAIDDTAKRDASAQANAASVANAQLQQTQRCINSQLRLLVRELQLERGNAARANASASLHSAR
jgi:hypothetical protein